MATAVLSPILSNCYTVRLQPDARKWLHPKGSPGGILFSKILGIYQSYLRVNFRKDTITEFATVN